MGKLAPGLRVNRHVEAGLTADVANRAPSTECSEFGLVLTNPARGISDDPTRPARLHGGRLRDPAQGAVIVDREQTNAVYTSVYHISMAKTVPVREFRRNLSRLLSDVADRRDHVLVSRHGRPAAVLVPVDEYEALEETAEILSDPDALAALEAGLAEFERGETVSLEDIRRELDEHRPRG
jgi:antitoxin YefM